MSLLTSIFKARDKPENRTAGSSYTFFMGGSTAGKIVTERSAMQMTAVYSCVRILAEAIAGLPLHLYRYTDSGGKEKATDRPSWTIGEHPALGETSNDFASRVMTEKYAEGGFSKTSSGYSRLKKWASRGYGQR